MLQGSKEWSSTALCKQMPVVFNIDRKQLKYDVKVNISVINYVMNAENLL